MKKNIIKSNQIEHFSDISYFPNTVNGAYDPTKPDPLNPNAPSIPNNAPKPLTPYLSNGVKYVDVPQPDGTKLTIPESDYNPPQPVDNNIYGDFTLRMYKLPADLTGNYIPITKPDPVTGTPTPIKINQPMDNDTGKFTKSSFLIGLNTAISQCIKFKECYAVVIPDSKNSSYYTYYLAQKPLSNNKNANSDNEYFLCNNEYVSYLKNLKEDGRSNIMTSTVSCDITSNRPISYSGSGSTKKTPEVLSPSTFKYKSGGKSVDVEKPPYLLYGCIGVIVLLVIGGIYYYNTQVSADEPVVSSVNTSKLIKKKGGYFFFV
jgi:hypothetical protein